MLSRGYAYAATDKGNTGLAFYRDGTTPGDAVAEWNDRLTQLTQLVRRRSPGATTVLRHTRW
ncbi:hypothetical protein SVIOM74S_08681 [Streptomyces violarus]